MNPFYHMLKNTISSSHYDRMKKFVKPLEDHLGINHFWYYKITYSGNYCYLGTHTEWSEYCFDKALTEFFPCLRHPDTLPRGINLMNVAVGQGYKTVQDIAWEKYKINFNLNLIHSVPDGVEAFGFGSRFNDPQTTERLLNDLPMLYHFVRLFRERNRKLLQLLDENKVNIASYFGMKFFENVNTHQVPYEKDKFLLKLISKDLLSLTKREREMMKLLANGYPASYIAQKLHLRMRTIENYIAIIKCKLSCKSKVELIRKAQDCISAGFLDSD